MRRGEVWIAAGEGDYLGKPRPVIVVQSDLFPITESITVCPITSEYAPAPAVRPTLVANAGNGLRATSYVMVDKISSVRKSRLSRCVGLLAQADMANVDSAVMLFLGIAVSRA